VTRLRLSVGICDYDHVRDLVSGGVPLEGVELLPLELPIEEIFHRFLNHREWDVSEISLAKYSALVSQGDASLVAIPVFPSRVFRHSSMFVRADAGLDHPSQLRGRRIGIPEWAQTAAVYTRGLLAQEYGVPLTEVEWVQAGVNEPGRREKVELSLPDGVSYRPMPQCSLSQMLLDREVDAVFSAHPPDCFERGDGTVVRLFRDPEPIERAYWAKTGIFPIMHTVVVRRAVVDADPWVPATLFKGFEAAKRRSIARLLDRTISRFPVPWLEHHVTAAGAGDDPWPYGVEPNRPTLEAFLDMADQQGVLAKPLRPEDLFSSSVDEGFRI
jgi:4,5-dihydroxyphthalate decarboxylase